MNRIVNKINNFNSLKVIAIIGTTWIPGCCAEHSRKALEEIEEKAKTRTAKYLSGKSTLGEVLDGSIY